MIKLHGNNQDFLSTWLSVFESRPIKQSNQFDVALKMGINWGCDKCIRKVGEFMGIIRKIPSKKIKEIPQINKKQTPTLARCCSTALTITWAQSILSSANMVSILISGLLFTVKSIKLDMYSSEISFSLSGSIFTITFSSFSDLIWMENLKLFLLH